MGFLKIKMRRGGQRIVWVGRPTLTQRAMPMRTWFCDTVDAALDGLARMVRP